MSAPVVEQHAGIHVVRDDLYPGGTKARFLPLLFEDADEIVYGSPQEGGAQTSLAHVARSLGKRATVFVAKRDVPHPRVRMAKRLGAKVMQVEPGYLSVVQSRAAAYAIAHDAKLAPFGMDFPEALAVIAQAARETGLQPDEVWCAAGSGVLMRGLSRAWPSAKLHAVQIGRPLKPVDVAGATIHVHPLPFSTASRLRSPFPADPHYDAKAWETTKAHHGAGLVVFWNVMGPA